MARLLPVDAGDDGAWMLPLIPLFIPLSTLFIPPGAEPVWVGRPRGLDPWPSGKSGHIQQEHKQTISQNDMSERKQPTSPATVLKPHRTRDETKWPSKIQPKIPSAGRYDFISSCVRRGSPALRRFLQHRGPEGFCWSEHPAVHLGKGGRQQDNFQATALSGLIISQLLWVTA